MHQGLCLRSGVCYLCDCPTEDDPRAGTVSQVFINPDECIDCGSCAALCAQNAIFPEADLPAEKAGFAEKNRAFFN